MICYLPFSHIPENPLAILAQALGPLVVYLPAKALITDSLHHWQEKGWVELHTPSGLDENRLLGQLQAFKEWAQLHDGHIGDMVHFFNTNQGQPPMVDQTAPSQIMTQVRHFGEDIADTEEGVLDQAALFLSLAQEYDRHQDKLGSELAAVVGMERDMFVTMGGGDRFGVMGDDTRGNANLPSVEDLGSLMTVRRLKAWARVAFLKDRSPMAYVTPSAAVFEYLKGLMDEMVDLSIWRLNQKTHHPDLKQQRHTALAALSDAANIDEIQLDQVLCGQPEDEDWVIEWVGCAGFLFEKLLPVTNAPGTSTNTVLGLVRPAN